MMMESKPESKIKQDVESKRLKLSPLGFEEAVKNIVQVKPLPKKDDKWNEHG